MAFWDPSLLPQRLVLALRHMKALIIGFIGALVALLGNYVSLALHQDSFVLTQILSTFVNRCVGQAGIQIEDR